VYLKLSPGVMGRIGAIVATRQLPAFRTVPDVIRDAVIHQLHRLGVMLADGITLELVDMNVALSELDEFRRQRIEAEQYLTQLREEGDRAVNRGSYVQLNKLLNMAESWTFNLEDSYRDELNELMTRFNGERARLRVKWERRVAEELADMTTDVPED
jgi:hypothetical protein